MKGEDINTGFWMALNLCWEMYLGIGQMYLGIGLAVSERDRLQGYSLKKPAIVTFDLRRSFHSNLSFGH